MLMKSKVNLETGGVTPGRAENTANVTFLNSCVFFLFDDGVSIMWMFRAATDAFR